MPTCELCDRGEKHKRRQCNDIGNKYYCSACTLNRVHFDCPNDEVLFDQPAFDKMETEEPAVIEGTGIITRIDRYLLSVDGHPIRATEDQERRIRALTTEQRERFLVVLGQLKDEAAPVTVAVDPASAPERRADIVMYHVDTPMDRDQIIRDAMARGLLNIEF